MSAVSWTDWQPMQRIQFGVMWSFFSAFVISGAAAS